MSTLQKDIQIITALGGPSKVAELLSLPKKGGQQRVHNWLARGIPAQVKVDRPDLFMRALTESEPNNTPALAHQAQAATETVAQGVAHA